MQFNSAQRELVLKIVYYGPPLSGKTTNLQALHRLLHPELCGRLTTLDTANDRTLFFDLLPLSMKTPTGYRIKLKLFTVPGQVIHAATRRLVLAGADGVVFVADSQLSEARNNNEFWRGMNRYMKENGIDPAKMPTVIQFNKRDLPSIRSEEDLVLMRKKGPEPIVKAVATRGDGVRETLYVLLKLLFVELNQRYQFEERFQISREAFLDSIFQDFVPTEGLVGEDGF
ncbi:MAG: GTPase domain-containing protein [Myxococcota bacterium]